MTPMMEQYLEIKKNYKYCILFFRLGDFYEMFFEDALIASKELEIALTGKNYGEETRAPMCGVPFHSADSYVSRLVTKGYKVAICEQVEDPSLAKGLVRREVVRVITAGTQTDATALDEKKNNYLLCIYYEKFQFGIAVCDITTGEYQASEFLAPNAMNKLLNDLGKYQPSEIICNEEFKEHDDSEILEQKMECKLNVCDRWMFQKDSAAECLCNHFSVHNLDGYGLRDKSLALSAAGGLLQYLYETQKNDLRHISALRLYTADENMTLDLSSRRNLELTETMRDKSRQGSLLWVLDQTKTAIGARCLRKWIEQPLCQKDAIEERLEGVMELREDVFLREELKVALKPILDFERLMNKVVYQTANGRDMLSLETSFAQLPLIQELLRKAQSPILQKIYDNFDSLTDIHDLINQAIVDEPPFSLREGGILKYGYNGDLDVLINAKKEGKQWVKELEQEEREKTGIKNLKISVNRVFGYYIEVTKSNIDDVPEDRYIRKQTLANCERYTTAQLNDLAELVLGSDEKMAELEYKLFCELRQAIAMEMERIQYTASLIAVIDVLQSLAEVAEKNNYCKPTISIDGTLSIKDGRHPVVEKLIGSSFVANDTFLDNEENLLSIITGPNMAGKSTYMRQTALIVLMAQIGSFVPAKSANISIVDRIFTRVGASDDLTTGQSTFMVEMTEVANILHNATANSLIILDEIGRGTSTFDGLSIAWAVLEYISDPKLIGAKTLFATHYHELTELEGQLRGVKNYCIMVKEQGDDIIFLRKIKRGGADHSYGVQVARLAGLPHIVIKRAGQILKKLNAADITKKAKKLAAESREKVEEVAAQLDFSELINVQLADELNKLDVLKMTPMEAMQALFDLQKKAKGL